MKQRLRTLWRGLREFCGDDAYDRYLRDVQPCPRHGPTVLSRREFYAQREARKWSSIHRCC